MKLRSVAVNQFKKFSTPVRLDGIGDGLNVVIGPNEMGKSTILDALRAALFEKHGSKAQPILALQNDRNQAAPVVEMAFELDDGVYRITKRFIKKPYARLSCPDGRIVEGDAAEDMLRGLLRFDEPGKSGAKAETLGMWNVLWVKQGHSFGELAIPDTARSSLHTALEAEVGTVLGGRRGRTLPQVIETQLAILVTSANKPRGIYKDAIERSAILAAQVADLTNRRRELSETLDELEVTQGNLARLSDISRDQQDQQEIEEARQRHIHLSEIETKIAGAITELELRTLNLNQAIKISQDRQQLKDDVAEEKASLARLNQDFAKAQEQEAQIRARVDTIRAEAHKADEAASCADDVAIRARKIMTAVGHEKLIRELEARLAKARDAENRQRQAQQKAAAIPITQKVLSAIVQAQKELDATIARLSAAATLVSFDIPTMKRDGIELDGEPLDPEQASVRVVEPIVLSIADRGRISVEPAIKDRDSLVQQNHDAATNLKRALANANVATLADAEEQFAIRQGLLDEARLAGQEVDLHAPAGDDIEAGVQALADHIDGLNAIMTQEKADLAINDLPTPREAEDQLQTAGEQARIAHEAAKTMRAGLSGPEQTLARLQADLASARTRHDEAEHRMQTLERRLSEAEVKQTDEAIQSAIDAATAAVSEQNNTIARLQSQRTDETLAQLKARISRIENALNDRRTKRSTLKESVASLRSRIEASEAAGLDEAIANRTRDLELATTERDRLEREVHVLGLLLSTLRRAELEAKERYLSPVIKRVRPYLQLLFPGADINIDENLQITGVVRHDGHQEAFEHLSLGTQEQIAILVRLAFAEMLVEQGHPATMILDDALVFSDDTRMKRMFDIMTMAAGNVQILVLTCREQLFEGLGGRNLTLAGGSPEDLISA